MSGFSKYDMIIHDSVSRKAAFRLIAASYMRYGENYKLRLNAEQQRQVHHFAKQGVKVRLK